MASYDSMSSLRAAIQSVNNATDRDIVFRSVAGVIAETVPRTSAGNASLLADGTLYLMGLSLLAGDVATNITIGISVAATGISLSKLALYGSTGTLLASSVDQGTSWNTSGLKTVAMQAAYTVPSTGLYYVGLIGKAGTTLPSVFRTISNAATAGGIFGAAVGAGAMIMSSTAGLTDLASPATITLGTAPGCFWAAIT